MKPADAMSLWLDTVPLSELTSESSIRVVKDYKNGSIVFDQALCELWENCSDELSEWVDFNGELHEIINAQEQGT